MPDKLLEPGCKSRSLTSLVRQVSRVVLLLLLVSSVAFFAFSVLPSDPVRNMVGVNASEDAVTQLRHELGYDKPWSTRYVHFLLSIVRLDLGESLVTRRPVGPTLLHAYAVTLSYVGSALAIAVLASFLLLLSAVFGPEKFRSAVIRTAGLVTSIPSLVVATGLGVALAQFIPLEGLFSINVQSFGVAALSLSLHPSFSLAEIAIRASQRAEQAPFTAATKSFGFSDLRVFWMCIFRPALVPWLGHFSNVAAALVTGSVIVEAVFSLPGLGQLLVQSVQRGDLPMMQGIVLASVLGFFFLDYGTRAVAESAIGEVDR